MGTDNAGAAPARTTNLALTALLAAGPVLTVHLLVNGISSGHLTTFSPAQYLLTALLFWSPLPFSLPAVLLDTYRDAYLPGVRGVSRLLRGALLLPYLLSSRSPVRVESAASLAGFIAATLMAVPVLL